METKKTDQRRDPANLPHRAIFSPRGNYSPPPLKKTPPPKGNFILPPKAKN
jgi:hypothetical protein